MKLFEFTISYTQTSNQSLLLSENAAFQFANNHAQHIYGSNSVYTYIPKVACSTMRFSIAKANGVLGNLKDINWINSNEQAFKPNLRELAQANFTFVILRNPYDRLASVFLDQIVERGVTAWKLQDTSNRSFEMGELSFSDFVNLIAAKPKLLNSDILLRPQSNFLIYEKYDKYFKFKDFENITKTLKQKISLDITDTRKALKHDASHLTMKEDAKHPKLSANDIFKMKLDGKCPSHKSLYNPALKTIVRKIYQRDFEVFESKFGKILEK